ncbi:hypothetical protein UG55_102455 [Frankia sp. EI5c]|uniref:hypothetical protein n=1 Tax=Frankia sp. EI5c TaxID=683316 RepID=UPI0007C2F804|nr:hypothetical protein [Frankia sp. EI5c]OAA25234.1 hypothetical protein UG55_102455 [Frankia sp. EI5c]
MTAALPRRVSPPGDGDPTAVGPYRVLGRIARGPAGLVLLSRAVGGAQVALRVPDPATLPAPVTGDPARERLRERFAAAATRARNAAHPARCAVLDAGVLGDEQAPGSPLRGLPYLVTEYVDGPTLAEEIAERGPLSPAELAKVAATLLEVRRSTESTGAVDAGDVVLSLAGPRLVSLGLGAAPPDPAHQPAEDPGEDPAGRAWARVLAFAATGLRPPPEWPRSGGRQGGRGRGEVDPISAAVLGALPPGRTHQTFRDLVAGSPGAGQAPRPPRGPRAPRGRLGIQPSRPVWRPAAALALCAATAVTVAAAAGPSTGPATVTAAAAVTAAAGDEPGADLRGATPEGGTAGRPGRPARETPRQAPRQPGLATPPSSTPPAPLPAAGGAEALVAAPAPGTDSVPGTATAARQAPPRTTRGAVNGPARQEVPPGAPAVRASAPPAAPPQPPTPAPAPALPPPAAPTPVPTPVPSPPQSLTPVQVSVVPLAPR